MEKQRRKQLEKEAVHLLKGKGRERSWKGCGMTRWTEEEMRSKMNMIHNCDCLEFMKQVPDNYFDLVLTFLSKQCIINKSN